MRNEIGQRGEVIFSMLITKRWNRKDPIFRPQFLGDKWPTVDFLVELIGVVDFTPYFFVQVKTTRTGYTNQQERLRTKIAGQDLKRLAVYPAPTYVVAIDEIKESGFIISANGEWCDNMSSVSTRFPLDENNQDLLWREVKKYWEKSRLSKLKSSFTDPTWR
jgi:hypothetical protein